MITVEQIIAPTTDDESLATLLAVAAALGLPTTAWEQDNPLLVLLRICATEVTIARNLSVEIAKSGFGELLPSDAWADLWAQSRYEETRVAALPATGYVTLTNSTATVHTLPAGELIVETGFAAGIGIPTRTYRNSSPITVPAMSALTVAVSADAVGSEYGTAPNTVSVITSSLPGVSVNNAAAIAGSDAETTKQLVDRCRAKVGFRSPNGAKGAYDYVAMTPAYSATSVPITRTRTDQNNSFNEVRVYLATAASIPSPSDVAIVQAALELNCEPWTAKAVASAAVPTAIPVSYIVWCNRTSLTEAQIKSRCDASLVKFFSELQIGGFLIPPASGAVYIQALQQAIGAAVPGIVRVAVLTPSADQYLAINSVAVLGAITTTVTIL